MRIGLLFSGVAAVMAAAALAISVIALVSRPEDLDDGYEFRLSDRAEFTVGLVKQALQRYEDEGREATLSYYNSPESAVGEWYVFILDENDEVVAHLNQDLLGPGLEGRSRGRRYRLPVRRGDARGYGGWSVGRLPVPQPCHRQPGVQAFLGRAL